MTDALPPEFQLPTKARGRGQPGSRGAKQRQRLRSPSKGIGDQLLLQELPVYILVCLVWLRAELSDRGEAGKPAVKTPSQNVVGTAAEERHRTYSPTAMLSNSALSVYDWLR